MSKVYVLTANMNGCNDVVSVHYDKQKAKVSLLEELREFYDNEDLKIEWDGEDCAWVGECEYRFVETNIE